MELKLPKQTSHPNLETLRQHVFSASDLIHRVKKANGLLSFLIIFCLPPSTCSTLKNNVIAKEPWCVRWGLYIVSSHNISIIVQPFEVLFPLRWRCLFWICAKKGVYRKYERGEAHTLTVGRLPAQACLRVRKSVYVTRSSWQKSQNMKKLLLSKKPPNSDDCLSKLSTELRCLIVNANP